MLKLTNYMKPAMIGFVILAVAACSATFEDHGYVPTDSDLEEIIVGMDTRESVAQTVGRPTSVGVLASGGWYYTQSRWRNFAYKASKIIDRQVVAISFTDDGIVENIERFTLADGQVVPLSRRVTDSNIKGISLISQLLGNLGNFTAGQILGE